jgi:hypothetical protein
MAYDLLSFHLPHGIRVSRTCCPTYRERLSDLREQLLILEAGRHSYGIKFRWVQRVARCNCASIPVIQQSKRGVLGAVADRSGIQEVEGDIDMLGNGDLPWGSVKLVEKESEGFNWIDL